MNYSKLMSEFSYSYTRKSTDETGRQILSLDSQADVITELEKKYNLKVTRSFTDKKTGKIPRARPQFNELWTILHKHQQKKEKVILLAWKINRLGRNPEDVAILSQMMWDGLLVIYTEKRSFDRSTASEFSDALTDATKFSHDLSDDVRTGMQKKATNGWRPGLAALGYLNDPTGFKGEKKIFTDPVRFDLVRNALNLVRNGTPVGEAHQAVTGWGLTIKQRKGGLKPVSIQRFRKILREEFYYGYYYWRNRTTGLRELIKGQHQPMLTKTEWDQLQDQMSGKKNIKRPKENNFWFMRLIKCSHCEHYVTAETTHKKLIGGGVNEHIYLKCKCRNNGVKKLRAVEAESQLKKIIETVRTEPEFVYWLKDAIKEVNEYEFERIKSDKASQTKRQQQVLTEMKQLVSAKDAGMVSELDEVYQKDVNRLKGELVTISSQIADIGEVEEWMDDVEKLLDLSAACQKVFASKDPDVRRNLANIISRSNLVLDGRKILIQPKSAFTFLKNKEMEYPPEMVWSNQVIEAKNGVLTQKGNSGAPDVLLHRLPEFIKEFSSSPILPDFLYELQAELALKIPQTVK